MNKEVVLYLFFGILTTFINILSFWILDDLFNLDYKIATTLAWFLSVIFAFITNKKYVFNQKSSGGQSVRKELISFFFFRGLSYILDLAGMVFLVEVIHVDSTIAKVITNIIVIIANYFASKYAVFRKSYE
ncbi:GtrA family protein [Bacillus sp. ISL-18]|uniref:GtrA family protein n=1 Tax=Bacillus sp. ISL-18 TaxID=2819118 RepID=UPI001BEB1D6D|nr:GtrA family protein [Bacillus sp. ISL-18]MBT2655290.1 GtrA family protein [Bacillus sp. ISL-18]